MQDVIRGYRTLYPINLGLSSSFDMELCESCAKMAAKEASIDGVHLTFAPMIDVSRDARWGRVMETSGEDTYLAAEIAKATVKGFKGENGKYGLVPSCKHFAAYGAPESGKDYNLSDISEVTLRETYLPPYKAAIDEGAWHKANGTCRKFSISIRKKKYLPFISTEKGRVKFQSMSVRAKSP